MKILKCHKKAFIAKNKQMLVAFDKAVDGNRYAMHPSNDNLINAHEKITQLTKNNIVIKEYYSAHHAERETGIIRQSIAKCCKGKIITAGGFKWEYTTQQSRG